MINLKDAGALNLLTGLIWGEARGEPIQGKLAVAWVAQNRVFDARWPDTFEEVILQPLQFSCFNEDDPNFKSVIHHMTPSCGLWPDENWRECRWAADGIISHWVKDLTKGANHYHSNNIDYPPWASLDKITIEIENHIFYRL